MLRPHVKRLLTVLLCLGLALDAPPSKSETLHAVGVEVVVGIVAIGVGATVGIVFLVKHHPTVKGCISTTPGGLGFAAPGESPLLLSGDTAGLKPGELVRIKGKKHSIKDVPGQHTFTVDRLVKDLGPCAAQP